MIIIKEYISVFIDKEESEENEKWTDRALMIEYGRIDAIEIAESEDGRWIQEIRARCSPFPSPIPPRNPPSSPIPIPALPIPPAGFPDIIEILNSNIKLS